MTIPSRIESEETEHQKTTQPTRFSRSGRKGKNKRNTTQFCLGGLSDWPVAFHELRTHHPDYVSSTRARLARTGGCRLIGATSIDVGQAKTSPRRRPHTTRCRRSREGRPTGRSDAISVGVAIEGSRECNKKRLRVVEIGNREEINRGLETGMMATVSDSSRRRIGWDCNR